MMFAIVMGLSGLTIVFQKAADILGWYSVIGDISAFLDLGIFLAIIVTYMLKMLQHFDEVKKEFSHPVRINFFAASSISFLLLSIVFHSIQMSVAHYFMYIGMVMQTFFTFYTISFWINKNLEIAHSNPAWFIPIVGNVLVPVAGGGYLDNNILMYYFSIGIFFWIVLTAILINRIIFHHQLAQKFLPTLFIFIAPPAIAFIAYIKMYDSFDMFASFLYNLALFFTFMLFFMYKNFMKLKFFISWWAFTFPLAAVTIASMLAYKLSSLVVYKYFAYVFIVVTISIVTLVAIKTIQHMIKKEICIAE
jgi:tellurite resistance protein